MNPPALAPIDRDLLPEETRGSGPTLLLADRESTLAETRHMLECEGFSVVASAISIEEALDAALKLKPELCLLATDLPGGGIAGVRELRRAGVRTDIAVLTPFANDGEAVAAIHAGADGYLPRRIAAAPLAAALRAIIRGEVVVPRGQTAALIQELRTATLSRHYGAVNRAVFYVPRFIGHLRRRRRSNMGFAEAWTSTRFRMREYKL